MIKIKQIINLEIKALSLFKINFNLNLFRRVMKNKIKIKCSNKIKNIQMKLKK